MYKLIIVDDEKSLRSGMANGIPWNDWDFTVTGTASDGFEALELIAKDKPDVVVSDIRMPNMDGVELMQYLNKNYPEIKIIILSGYSDFDYLNYSIKNNVAEYLLKPTDLDEFESLFKRLKSSLDADKQRENTFAESRGYHLNTVLANLMLGYVSENTESTDEAILSETPIDLNNCYVVMMYVEWLPQFRDDLELSRTRRKIVDILNTLKGSCDFRFFLNHQDKIIGVVSKRDGISNETLTDFLKHILNEVKAQTGFELYACVSSPCTDRRMLPQSCQQVIATAHRHAFSPDEKICFYEPVTSDDVSVQSISFNYDIIINYIVSGKRDKAEEEIVRVFEAFGKVPESAYSYIDNQCLELLFFLSRKSITYNINFEQIMSDSGFGYDDFRRLVGLQMKKKFILKAVNAMIDCMSLVSYKDEKTKKLAHQIKEVVDSEYLCNHISLEYIGEKVNKSSAYVSRMFKDEYGCNFSEYITDKRLEKSKELLADKELKIYEISNMTGYADVSNFIKVFKKKYGISPGDYRNYIK